MQEMRLIRPSARAALSQLPTSPAVFALYGAEAKDEPYIGRTPNLRGAAGTAFAAFGEASAAAATGGAGAADCVSADGVGFRIAAYAVFSFEEIYGAKALERMHLRAPAFVRYLGGNPYPRIVVTNKPSQREADWAYGPFASRAAAERFAEEALKLFLLRRCTDDLNPDPEPSGLRVLGDEDVPCALLQGLHR